MTPSADMPDGDAQQQSFSLASMVPQSPQLNRGVWAGIEMAVRNLAAREGELYVVTGPAFHGAQLRSIGSGVPGAVVNLEGRVQPAAGRDGGVCVHQRGQASVPLRSQLRRFQRR
jgi:endonuclease G